MERSGQAASGFSFSRVKSLLAAVVFAAVVLAGAWNVAGMKGVATNYRAVASLHAIDVRSAEKALNGTDIPEVREWLTQKIRYHKQMEHKYLTAASRPWSPVAKDPEAPPLPIPSN